MYCLLIENHLRLLDHTLPPVETAFSVTRIFDTEIRTLERGRSMEKVDFKKDFDYLFKPSSKEFSIVKVPPLKYLMVDGEGDPNTSPEYVKAIEALYSVSYTLKFMSKNELGRDYVVPPLESLWWADDMSAF